LHISNVFNIYILVIVNGLLVFWVCGVVSLKYENV
jgi:hypothetical protein